MKLKQSKKEQSEDVVETDQKEQKEDETETTKKNNRR